MICNGNHQKGITDTAIDRLIFGWWLIEDDDYDQDYDDNYCDYDSGYYHLIIITIIMIVTTMMWLSWKWS
jgi:hypothetical protein